jgi:hypothetical protein
MSEAHDFVSDIFARSLWPGDEASFEREQLRCKHRRERQALREKHKIQKQGNTKQHGNT